MFMKKLDDKKCSAALKDERAYSGVLIKTESEVLV